MDAYTIQTLNEEHIKSAIELFSKSFCESDPLIKHLNIHYNDYQPFAFEVIHKAAKEGMSKVVLDKQHRVIACAIAEDIADPFIPHFAHYPKLKPIIVLFDELSQPFVSGKRFVTGKIVHVSMAAVDSSHRGQGLLTEIGMACVEAAARKGYDYAYAGFTNEVSENITHHFKTMQLCNQIKFDDFVFENAKPFKGVIGSVYAFIVTIRPGVKLDALPHCYQVTEGYH